VVAYSPTAEDLEMARAILDGAGAPGFYDDGTGVPVPLLVQWVGAFNEIGGFADTGPRARPFESAPTAFVAIEDVPEPEQDALVWFTGGAKHRVNGFAPEGGLWRLDMIPE
jgi:hypothetical protein